MASRAESIRLTRQKLIDSFWELSGKYELKDITIGKITKQAQLNRGTFYQYFNDIYDLLDFLEQELISELKGKLSMVLKNDFSETFDYFSEICTESFLKDNKKINLLLRNNPDFGKKIKKEMEPVLDSAGILPEEFPHKDFVISSIFFSILNIISYWHEHLDELSPQELLYLNKVMLLKGISGLSDAVGR